MTFVKKVGSAISFFYKIYSDESVLKIVLSGKSGALGLRDNITNADLLKVNIFLQTIGFENKLEQQYCTLSNEYVRYIKELRSLGKNQQQNINADKFNDDEKRAIAYYQHLRYGK